MKARDGETQTDRQTMEENTKTENWGRREKGGKMGREEIADAEEGEGKVRGERREGEREGDDADEAGERRKRRRKKWENEEERKRGKGG